MGMASDTCLQSRPQVGHAYTVHNKDSHDLFTYLYSTLELMPLWRSPHET
jgi:hypothetical protein